MNSTVHDKGYIWIVEDITQQKDDKTTLLHAKEQAESSNAIKSKILTNISHDIRTPLHGVMGTFNLLKTTPLDTQQAKMVGGGLNSSDYLLCLLNGLLDLSKIEANQLIIDEYPFSIQSIATKLDDIFSSQFKEKGLTLKYHFAENVPEMLLGDSLRIQQILVNLVGNSFKFTQQGTISVSFEGENLETGKIKLLCKVEDHGIGIPTDQQNDLFEAFTQADTTISQQYGGTGLGLSISKELCTLMGGEIWFESTPGKGTKFYFTLLCGIALGKDKDPGKDIAVKDVAIQPLNILIVDDNDSSRNILRMMLELEGHTITATSDGHAALEILIDNSFDIIFMDMQMPVLDGLATTKIIRSCESGYIDTENQELGIAPKLLKALSGSYTPIIALTGNTTKKDKEICMRAGMDLFLSKPFLQNQINKVLSEL